MSKLTGPLLNRNYYLEDRPRSFFSDLPIGLESEPDYIHLKDDFVTFTDNAIYEEVADASTAFALVADAENGVMRLSSQATTDNSGVLLQAVNTNFLVVSGRNLWFEAKIKVSDADDGEMFIGLADTAATNPEAVVAEGLARVGFELIEGSAALNIVVDNDTAATKTILTNTLSDATYATLGFRTHNDQILYYVNRSYVGRHSIPSAIAAVTLGPSFFHLSGNDTGTHTADLDYWFMAAKRS